MRRAALFSLLLAVACVHRAPPPDLGEDDAARARIVAAARRHLGARLSIDCSTFVGRVLREAGVPVSPASPASSGSEALYRATGRVAHPAPGDLAFFHDTYDRDGDGRRDDPFTHVAIVEAVDGPRLTLIHRGHAGIARFRLDLDRPADPASNDALRFHRPGDPAGTRYLAGELLTGFGNPLPPALASRP
jgi:hypothetical protein